MGNSGTKHVLFHEESLSKSPYRRIGAGFCGSIWAAESEEYGSHGPVAIKREEGGTGRSLYNDFETHQHLLDTLEKCPLELQSFLIPLCFDFVSRRYAGWKSTRFLGRFPQGYSPCNILISERIPAVPQDVRHMLVDRLCPKRLIDAIKADKKNEDCLIRPYLGQRKQPRLETGVVFFSLRNCPLHVNQMEELKLDITAYATAMANALAFMHWSARIDANDVEFVLAPPSRDSQRSQFGPEVLGPHNLWLLDFDQCRSMSMNEFGVKHAAAAFLRNNPYYPRPGKEDGQDQKLWAHFRTAFIEASTKIIHPNDNRVELPDMLMDMIEELTRKNKQPSNYLEANLIHSAPL